MPLPSAHSPGEFFIRYHQAMSGLASRLEARYPNSALGFTEYPLLSRVLFLVFVRLFGISERCASTLDFRCVHGVYRGVLLFAASLVITGCFATTADVVKLHERVQYEKAEASKDQVVAQGQVEDFQKQLKQLDDAIEQLYERQDRQDKKTAALDKGINKKTTVLSKDIKEAAKKAATALSKTQKRVAKLGETLLADSEDARTDVNGRIEGNQKRVRDLRDQLDSVVDELRAMDTDLQRTLTDHEKTIETLQGEATGQSATRSFLVKKIEEVMQRTSDLEGVAKQQAAERTATAAQLEKLRESLVGFDRVVKQLGQQFAPISAAVDKMEAQGVATVTRINELTRFIEQNAPRVESGASAR